MTSVIPSFVEPKFNIEMAPDVVTVPPSQRVVWWLLPKSRVMLTWDYIIVASTVINILIQFFMLSFNSTFELLWVVVYLCDVIVVVDIVLTFVKPYYDHNAILITQRKLIYKRYLKRTFVLDLLSILPIDLIALVEGSLTLRSLKLIARLRSNRYIRFYKVMNLIGSWEEELGINTILVRSFKYLIICLISTHALACGWFSLACPGVHTGFDSQCFNGSWADNFDLGFDIKNTSTINAYVVSLYWSVATATSTGYGDISSVTLSEKWYAVMSMLIGIAVYFGMLLGGMTSMLTNMGAQRQAFVHRFNVIREIIKDLGAATDLQDQVMGYYEYLWLRKKGVQSEGVYDRLPLTFQAEISNVTNKVMLEKSPLFSDQEDGFLRMLSMAIKPRMYLPQQIIIQRGDVGQEMFFIYKGNVEILSEDDDESPVAVIKSGTLFGEISLVYSMPRTATVRAMTHCDVMTLSRHDMNIIVKHYPQVMSKLQVLAKQRCDVAEKVTKTNKTEEFNPHFKALQPRISSYVEPSSQRRRSFAVHEHGPAFHSSLKRTPSLTKRRLSMSVSETVDIIQDDYASEISLLRKKSKDSKQDNSSALSAPYVRMVRFIEETTIDPSGPLGMAWQSIIVVTSCIISVIYPYMACFTAYDARLGYIDTVLGRSVMALTYLLDILLLVDIFFNLRSFVETPNGMSVNFHDTLHYYCLTKKFFIDVVAILPLELFSFLGGDLKSNWHLFAFLRLNRVIKFLKVPMFFTKNEDSLHTSLGKVRTVKLAVYIGLLSHWAACILYLSACMGSACVTGSWILAWASAKREDFSFNETTAITEYITALYWSVATMTSTGYGDISAHTTLGRALALMAMLVGLLLYGYCLALMAATLANGDYPRVCFQERLFAVKNFMKENDLDIKLQKSVLTYLDMMWEKYRGEWIPGEPPLLHDLPVMLQQDIALDDALQTIAKVPLFKDTDIAFLRCLTLKTQAILFSPGEAVINAGDMGREMYCIRKGQCQILTPDLRQSMATIGPGQYFGEIGMIFGDYRTATVVCKTYCEILMLKMSDLIEVLDEFPLLKSQFEKAEKNKLMLQVLQKETSRRVKACSEKVSDSIQALLETEKAADTRKRWVKWKENSLSTFKMTLDGGFKNADYFEPLENKSAFTRCLTSLLMRSTLLPNGRLLGIIMMVMVIISIVNCITVPLQAAFLFTNISLWIFHYILDIIGFIYMYVSLHISYYNKNNVLVTHPLSTAKHYLRTNFLIDLISLFPIEAIVLAVIQDFSADNLHLYALVRFTRLIQMYRFPLAFNFLESAVQKETGNIRQYKFAVMTVIFMHLLTCTLFIMACPPKLVGSVVHVTTAGYDYQCIDTSWISHSISKEHQNQTSMTELYITALYWASATSVSVGYGDISAWTDAEMVICLVVMITGVVFFGFIIASVAASLANADAQRARFQDKLSAISKFMEDYKINTGLRKRVLAYYDYLWIRTKGVEPDSLFDGLPFSLWGNITLSLYKEIIEKISLFKDTEVSFIKMLSRCIKPYLFLKGEYVVQKHDIGQEMFFIHRGAVDVTSEDGTMIFDTMRAGASFGEVALLFSVPRTASIRAAQNSDVFCLMKHDLDQVLELYPTIKATVMKIGEERRQQARKRSAAKITVPQPPPPIAEEEKSSSKTSVHSQSRRGSSESMPPALLQPDTSRISQMSVVLDTVGEEQEEETREAEGVTQDNFEEDDEMADETEVQAMEDIDFEPVRNSEGVSGTGTENQTTSNNQSLNNNANNNSDAADSNADTEEPSPGLLTRWFQSIASFNKFVIRPENKAYRMFSTFMCVTGFLSGWLIMYQAGCQHHHISIIILNYICDVFFLAELYLKFHLSFYDDFGDLVEDFDGVSKHYLKSRTGFALDLVAALPIEIFAAIATGDDVWLWLSYLRLLHLLRLVRVFEFFSKWESELNINMLAARLCKFFVALTLMIHTLACIWFHIACPKGICDGGNSWIAEESGINDPADRYCSSIYWCVATMTSTGYGDISANSIPEMLFASIVMVSGKIMFGFILGNIASTLANEESNKIKYEEKLQAVKKAMLDQNVPKDLQTRVIEYYNYLWVRNKGIDMSTLFRDTPGCLVSEIYVSVYSEMFNAIPLFDGADASFLRQLSTRVKQLFFLPGDPICRKGDVGKEVYYIYKGTVDVYSGEKPLEVNQMLHQGDIFGDAHLLISLAHTADYVAQSHVNLFIISNSDLSTVLEYYPAVEANMQTIAKHVYRKVFEDTNQANAYARRQSKFVS